MQSWSTASRPRSRQETSDSQEHAAGPECRQFRKPRRTARSESASDGRGDSTGPGLGAGGTGGPTEAARTAATWDGSPPAARAQNTP